MTGRAALRAYAAQLTACRYVMAAQIATDEIDEPRGKSQATAVPKKGKHSVGVASQYASALGKNANCQTLVSLTLAGGEVPVMVALRLFLPENCTSDLARLKRAGVPAEYRTARTKPEIALAEIDRVIAAGVRFGCVLADAARRWRGVRQGNDAPQ